MSNRQRELELLIPKLKQEISYTANYELGSVKNCNDNSYVKKLYSDIVMLQTLIKEYRKITNYE